MSTEETAAITLTVNGEPVVRMVSVRQHLVDFLRSELGLTGAHLGCEHGVCGACSVRVDGVVVRGCLMLAVQADGSEVVTIEGLTDSGEVADLQEAFVERNALQCGFCTPGMLMTAAELLLEQQPEEQGGDQDVPVRQLLPLHRLSRHRRCRRHHAGGPGKGQPAMSDKTLHALFGKPNSYVGRTLSRTGAKRAVAGRGRYTDDFSLPRMLHAAFVRSPFAHARILAIDTAEAKRQPGVALVMTGAELAKLCTGPWVGTLTCFPGMKSAPQYPMAVDRACWAGEPVAMVVARTRAEAEDAAEKIIVEWEELPAATEKKTALDPGHARHSSRPRRQPRLPQGDRHRRRRRRLRHGRPRHRGHLRLRPPHGRQPRAARPACGLRQGDRQAHRPHLQPVPAHDPVRVRAHAGRARPQRADHRPRRRRLVRPQDPHLRRRGGGCGRGHPARPPRQVHRRPPGVVRLRHPRAREFRQGPHRGEQVRRDPGLRHRRAVRRRRLLAISAHQRVRGNAGAQHHRRPLQAQALPGARHGGLSQQAADLAVSRRRPPDRQRRRRAPGRSRRGRARYRPHRDAPPQRVPRRRLSHRHGQRHQDQGPVAPALHRGAGGAHELRRAARRAGAAAQGRHPSRHRHRLLHQGHRAGAAGLLRRRRRADLAAGRVRHQARAQRRRHLRGRRHRAGPGHRHRHGPDRRHRARRADGKRARDLRRHRCGALWRRHLRLARHRHRRRSRLSRRPRPARRKSWRSPACCCRPIPPRSTSTAAWW